MAYRPLVPPWIEALVPYVPGKPIEETEREHGIKGAIKLASNENPLGPSPLAMEAARRALAKCALYPDASHHALRRALAERHGVAPDQIAVGNGSNDIIDLVARAFLGDGDEALASHGAFLMFAIAVQTAGKKLVVAPAPNRVFDLEQMARSLTPRTRVVYLANPDNPTGAWCGRAELQAFLERVGPEVMVVVDQAYAEFVRDPAYPDCTQWLARWPRLVTLRTFSKIYGLAGLRVGYAVANRDVVQYLDRVRMPFNVNGVAQAAALAALDDEEFVERSRQLVWQGVDFLTRKLPELGITVLPSQGNFVFADLGRPAAPVYEALLKRGVIVRPIANYGFPTAVRISVGLPGELERLVAALREVL